MEIAIVEREQHAVERSGTNPALRIESLFERMSILALDHIDERQMAKPRAGDCRGDQRQCAAAKQSKPKTAEDSIVRFKLSGLGDLADASELVHVERVVRQVEQCNIAGSVGLL